MELWREKKSLRAESVCTANIGFLELFHFLQQLPLIGFGLWRFSSCLVHRACCEVPFSSPLCLEEANVIIVTPVQLSSDPSQPQKDFPKAITNLFKSHTSGKHSYCTLATATAQAAPHRTHPDATQAVTKNEENQTDGGTKQALASLPMR